MSTKKVFFLLCFIIELGSMYAQDLIIPQWKIVDNVYYDVEDVPLFKPLSDGSLSVYWLSPINSVVSPNVEFDGGMNAFRCYTDSVYFHYWESDCQGREINSWPYYTILFDSKLHILSVNIVLGIYARKEWGFDNLLKKIIYSTEGQWHKEYPEEQSKYYYWMGNFHFR